jgi:transcriptional regulator with GAF, ATPase, and Fis domain
MPLPLAAMGKNHIINVLENTQWQISGEHGAAAILEMHPNTLRSRMNKLGIRRSALAAL